MLTDLLKTLRQIENTSPLMLLRTVAYQLALRKNLPTNVLQEHSTLPLALPTNTSPLWLGPLYMGLIAGRHQRGSYYTPEILAEQVVQQTLFDSPRSVRRPKILDPAVGAGAFLIAAAIQLTQTGLTRSEALTCLYGVDADPVAVELAALTLWLWAEEPETTHHDVGAQLICADFLTEYPFDDVLFDALVGNPPYVSVFTRHATQQTDYRKRLKAQYVTAKGSFDLTVPFIEASLRVCRLGGRIGFVLPNKLLSASYAEPLRHWLLEHATLRHLAEVEAGFDANVYPIMVVWEKRSSQSNDVVTVQRGKQTVNVSHDDLALLPGVRWSGLFDSGWGQVRRCLTSTVALGTRASISAGLTVSEAYDLKPYVQNKGINNTGAVVMLLTSGVIHRYQTTWHTDPVRYLKQTYQYPLLPVAALSQRRQRQAQAQKLIIAGLGKRPRVLLNAGNALASVSTVIITEAYWSLEAMCALLNSDRVAWLYGLLYGGLSLGGGYLRFGKRELSDLPIPDVSAFDARIRRLSALYGLRLLAEDPAPVEAEINQIADDLYGFPER